MCGGQSVAWGTPALEDYCDSSRGHLLSTLVAGLLMDQTSRL